MVVAERDLQRVALEMRVLQERGLELQRQASTFKALLEESRGAGKALKALLEASADGASLFPLGGGAMVEAKPVDSKKVLFEAGAGVVLETPSEQAAKTLEERAEKLSQAASSVDRELEQVSLRMEQLRSFAARLQQAGQ